MPASTGTGIHWQVAQATSLQNIRFEMIKGAESKQQGIFMDNGTLAALLNPVICSD
jgi:glucan 1,3-beta-glucosidase